jgi:hypothetical protein
MRWRRISESEIESALLLPDFTEPCSGTRMNAWKKLFSGRYLRITYRESEQEIAVLTAVKKKKKGWR